MIDTLAIGLGFGLIIIGVIGIAIGGVRNVITGKSDVKRVVALLVPVAVLGITYAIFGNWGEAGMATMLIMMGFMVVGILITGTRGTFKF
ncbi:MAG: hypothetical protein JJU46_11030 [Balneolaceae bacterium]|nr:hypothetical protein [Balneolaceae bacterium]MCH8547634.1 hypothetical protein [Balneolaceae bacterium]